jgi:HPt (histidine-containing phosphotransfer) domain-containing protein
MAPMFAVRFPPFDNSRAMFETLGQFDQLLASVCGVIVGACGCWFVQCWRQQRPRSSRRSYAYTETPAITAAAQANASCWSEPEQLLRQVCELLAQLETNASSYKAARLTNQGRNAVRQLQEWLLGQKNLSLAAKQDDTAAALIQRAAEDDLVVQWLNENPARVIASASRAAPESAPPELALTQIASELLPFNPIAVRLIGKTADADMSAAVERIEKLLASVDPPESLGTMPAALETAPTIRDPQARYNMQSDDQQRRRSDQAIIYDTLLRRCLGDDDFAWRMLHKFPTRCRTELESLATEIRRRAWTSATRRITQLRGMAANLAAENLRDALANLENVCRQQSATRADQLLEGVYGEFQQVLDFLARAGGEQPRNDEIQQLSRCPAALLPTEDHAPLSLELHPAARVS